MERSLNLQAAVCGSACRTISLVSAASMAMLCTACVPQPPLKTACSPPLAQKHPVTQDNLRFDSGTLAGWTAQGEGIWRVQAHPDDPARFWVTSLGKGETGVGTLRSAPFSIAREIQRFSLAGADGTAENTNDGERNHLLLRSHPDGEILRRARPPGTHVPAAMKWDTWDLIGREVYLEIVDDNPRLNPRGFAWMGLADYRQENSGLITNPVQRDDLFGLEIDEGAERTICRTVPFWAAAVDKRGQTTRVLQGNTETIPVGAAAETLFLLGMINHGWDVGVSHWGEHPELRKVREDQIHVGSRIGTLEIRYADASSDEVPLVMGATAWFHAQWAFGPSHGVAQCVREPFASRPEYAAVFDRCMKIKESDEGGHHGGTHRHYFLAVEPRPAKIESIVIRDNPDLRGRPLISAVTLAGAEPADGLEPFGNWRADAADLEPAFKSARPGNWSKNLTALADVLYTKESDLPKRVELIEFPEGLNAARIRFQGDVMADMLSNIWVANLAQIAEKFDRETGFFHESGKDYPWYGGYSGIGTWAPIGVYYSGAFGRCSDHFVTLALRCIDDPVRVNSFVDFTDKYFYYYRANHDPEKGPPNPILEVERYPKDAPSHWAFVITGGNGPWQINEIPGDEETDGHGATIVARWVAWRNLGAPTGEWLTTPREEIFGKSRWDVTREAAEFVCWLMDYTGMDVLYCEGETTGWGGKAPWGMRLTGVEDWPNETDREKIRRNYANANMYEVYPSHVCMIGLRCSAQIADALGKTDEAKRWRTYADRLQAGMVRLLAVGEHGSMKWKESRFSVYPSLQDSLVQAWFAIYYDGLDPQRWDAEMTGITRNTLRRQLSHPYGHAAVLGMGYGQGWLTKAALILDEFDDAGPLLANIPKYVYDKNMNYVDEERGIDWRKYQWMVPEGTNILPDGSWYRIGDLTNGANQGPIMHVIELCAGIDDTKPAELKIMPRVPDPLTGIEVVDFQVLIPEGERLSRAKVSYTYDRKSGAFKLETDRPLPTLAVRLGPFTQEQATRERLAGAAFPNGSTQRIETSGHFHGKAARWIWVEDLRDVSNVEIELN